MAFDPITEGFSLAKTVLDKFFPDADTKLKGQIEEAAQEIANANAALMGQLAINQEEAKSSSMFVAGWRPFIGWIGGLGIGYEVLLKPLANGISFAFGAPTAIFPGIDISLLQSIIGAMLGLGVARSYDKSKGVDTKKIGK